MEESQLETTGNDAANTLVNEDQAHNALAVVGAITVIVGVVYVGTRLVQNVIYRRRIKKLSVVK